MRIAFTRVLVLAAGPLSSALLAQMGSWGVAEQHLGRPTPPPFISLLGIVAPGKLSTDPSLRPKGPVAEVLLEELRDEAGSEVTGTVRCKYDEQGRVVEEYRRAYGVVTLTTSRYEGDRLVSQESTYPESKAPRPKFWNYWKYDDAGKLIEYRRGSGDTIQNHETNFTRDAKGRLTSFEYHQGAKDELSSRTEFRYSSDGRAIDTISYDAAGAVTRSMKQTVDGEGRVVEAVIQEFDWRTKKPKRPIRVVFAYDSKGRLVEQNTDPYEFEPQGGEQDLPPGKVLITYSDADHTKTTEYSVNDGRLTAILTYDADGGVTGVDLKTGAERSGTRLECDADSHGNWARCRQISTNGAADKATKIWRRTITYR